MLRRAPELRTVVTRDGSVLKIPRVATRNVTAKEWQEFFERYVAAPHDFDDAHDELGGEA